MGVSFSGSCVVLSRYNDINAVQGGYVDTSYTSEQPRCNELNSNDIQTCADTWNVQCSSAKQLQNVAALLAPYVQAGDIILLEGDLGAGKTCFTQGLAHAMGTHDDVVSPTFNLLLSYATHGIPLYHFDLYRLDTYEQLDDIAFYETIEGDGVSCIEWGEKFIDALGDDILRVYISVDEQQNRQVHIQATGARSAHISKSWHDAYTQL